MCKPELQIWKGTFFTVLMLCAHLVEQVGKMDLKDRRGEYIPFDFGVKFRSYLNKISEKNIFSVWSKDKVIFTASYRQQS